MTVPNAVTHRGDRIAATANEDQRLLEFHAGILTADGKIGVAGAAPAANVLQGILRGAPSAGGDATLQVANTSQAVAGAAIPARNTRLVPNAAGRLVPAAAGQISYYRALSTATADGQLVTVHIGFNGTA